MFVYEVQGKFSARVRAHTEDEAKKKVKQAAFEGFPVEGNWHYGAITVEPKKVKRGSRLP